MVRYLLCYLLGVGLYHTNPSLSYHGEVLTILSFLIFLVLFHTKGSPTALGITCLSSLVFIGITNSSLKIDKEQIGSFDQFDGYTFQVIRAEGSTETSQKWIGQIRATNVGVVEGRVLVYAPHNIHISPGDIIAVRGNWETPESAHNPHEFNYNEYLLSRGIIGVHFLKEKDIKIIGAIEISSIQKFLTSIRSYCERVLFDTIESERERGVAMALLTGNKTGLDEGIKKIYSDTGAMHILAVSGLHVGIVFIGFGRILGFIPKIWLRQLLLISLIWVFAGITGFSPSVVRASAMFSTYSLSLIFNRKSSIYNTIATAGLIMILVDPNSLFDVGFQLSFLAVTSIVFFQPKIKAIFYFKSRLARSVWELSSVGIAAQLGTFPLSLYYFHQFPTYFFLSNLIVIPLAFIIVNLGMVLLLLFKFQIVNGVAWLIEKLLWISNEILELITYLPGAVIEIRNMPLVMVLLIYGIILSTILLLKNRSYKWFILSTVLIISLICCSISNTYELNRPRVIMYHVDKGFCIDFFKNGKRFTLSESQNDKDEYSFQGARRAYGNKPLSYRAIQVGKESQLIVFENQKFLILREFISLQSTIEIDYILITNGVKEKWLESWAFSSIILSNEVKAWEKNLVGINYHDLRESAYMVIF